MTHIKNQTDQTLKHFDLIAARVAYQSGQNVTDLLRNQKGVANNTPEIIEAAYDLQAGAYIARTKANIDAVSAYAEELASCLSSHISNTTTLLDIGCGELTTLSLTLAQLPVKPKRLFVFDISWSRVFLGCAFADEVLSKEDSQLLQPFVADINEIPISDKSVDVTTSSHALEPNGDNLALLLLELFRVTRHKLVLFEPCYEINTEVGKARMDALGYIKNIEGVVSGLGGKIIDKIRIANSKPLNPTVCFVIEPPVTANCTKNPESLNQMFSVPGTNFPMLKIDEFYVSKETGLCFPILKGIPILKTTSAILASALTI